MTSGGLCYASSPELVDQTFKYILTDVKEQDYYIFFANLAFNRNTTRRMVSFLKEHYDDVSLQMTDTYITLTF